VWQIAVVVVAVVLAVLLLPGLDHVRRQIATIAAGWLILGAALEVLSSMSYVAVFHPVFCPGINWRISSRIGMAELGIDALLPAGGTSGLALGAWALRKRGMPVQQIACRSVGFFVLTSAVNFAAVIAFGLALASGLLAGQRSLGLTLVPALLALAIVVVVVSLPAARRRRARRRGGDADRRRLPRRRALVARGAAVLADGVGSAIQFLRSGDPLVYLGAIGYWAFDNAVLWVCFRALGHPPPVGVVVIGYLIGQLGAALPLPGGIGGVEAGLIGTLVVLGVHASTATAAVLSYRALQLWIPALLGGAALATLPGALNADADLASADRIEHA
jgi:uncharacterized protein (TIRG00374 family)